MENNSNYNERDNLFFVIEKVTQLGVWELSFKDKKLRWSNGLYHILDIDGNIKPDMRIYRDMLNTEDIAQLDGAIMRLFKEKKSVSFEHKIFQKNGKNFFAKTYLSMASTGRGENKIIGILQNIQKQKIDQQEAKNLSLIASETSNAVVITNKDGKIDWINKAFTRITGFHSNEIQNIPFEDLVLSNNSNSVDIKEFFEELKKRDSISAEIQIKNKVDKYTWVLLNMSSHTDLNLNALKYILILSDISEKKKYEESLQSSMQYAKRIQENILFKYKAVEQSSFSDIFILFKPRELVSGDFYWFAEKKEKLFIALVDCTGHGVPAGLLSIAGNDLLNESLNSRIKKEPSRILKRLQKGIVTLLHQEKEKIGREGMDIGLCVFDRKENKMEFAGARIPLFYTYEKDGKTDILEIEADKISIGDMKKNFSNHNIDICGSKTFYLTSDGYRDQLNDKYKKFGKKRFKEILLEISQKSFEEQKDILQKTLVDWRGKKKQIDDILIIGFKL